MSQRIRNYIKNNEFFQKNGSFSKTAVILCAAWVLVLFKFLFATCVIDITILGIRINWPIIFNWSDAGAVLGAASSLYFAVHNMGKKDESFENKNLNGFNRPPEK
jgi:hypothetical protein